MLPFRILLAAALIAPAPVLAVPSHPVPQRAVPLFTTLELNNLSRLDETSARPAPTPIKAMQTEIAMLRDEVGHMQLGRLIDTVLTEARPTRH